MIFTSAQVFINRSCILGNNKGKTLFYELSSNCEIILTGCTIDDDIKTTTRYTGGFRIESTIKTSFINRLTHIITNECDSFLDSYGSLTAAPLKQQKRTKLRVLSFSEYIFIIKLILPNPS